MEMEGRIGFGPRLGAYLIDGVVMGIVGSVVGSVIGGVLLGAAGVAAGCSAARLSRIFSARKPANLRANQSNLN